MTDDTIRELRALHVVFACSCGGRRWVDDENWQPSYPAEPWTRTKGDGLIPCGFCNEGGWDTREGEAHEPWCAVDDQRWPCDVSRLLDALSASRVEPVDTGPRDAVNAALDAINQRVNRGIGEGSLAAARWRDALIDVGVMLDDLINDVEDGFATGSEAVPLSASRAAGLDGLSEAWAAAAAAVPAKWGLSVAFWEDHATATAYGVVGASSMHDFIEADGPTPTLALQALTAALSTAERFRMLLATLDRDRALLDTVSPVAEDIEKAYSVGRDVGLREGRDDLLREQLNTPSPEAPASLDAALDVERLADIAVMALGEVTTGAAYGLYHKSFREHFVARLARAGEYRPLAAPDVTTLAEALRDADWSMRDPNGRKRSRTGYYWRDLALAARLTLPGGQS